MDHYQNPRNYGTLENPDFSSGEHNPSCGDIITIQGNIENDRLTKICFTAQGCVISVASASLLTEYAHQKTLETITAITPQQMQEIIGITLGPLRIKCALLSLIALQKGIQNYTQTHLKGS